MDHSRIAPIILIEDDENDVFFVQHALTAARIQNPLTVFPSAERAYAFLGAPNAGGAPVLIILDLQLAGLDTGLDALRWLRQQAPPLGTTPVIILTASESSADRERSDTLGAYVFLNKPVSETSLTEAVRMLGVTVVSNLTSGEIGFRIVDQR